jgi:hypothetical protein
MISFRCRRGCARRGGAGALAAMMQAKRPSPLDRSMIPKNGDRLSEKITLKQKVEL